jgi:pectinesterase
MNFKNLIFLYCFVVCIAEVSAMQTIIKDTSYSVKSSFLKYKNEFSSLKIIQQKNSKNVLEKNTITYKILPNRNLVLDAFINSKQNNTAVIILHGGGWKSGDKSHIKPLAQCIASKGYSCFAIEYRLSDEAKYPESIYDVKDAIKYIKQQAKVFHIDTTKIAILGASSGAQMATLIGTTNNNPKFEVDSNYKTSSTVQAIVNLDGILAFKHPESKEGKMASLWLGGTYEEIPEVWAEASALTHTDKNTPPILFINSQYERFHAGRDDMIKILNKYYIYSQVKTIPNSPHTFWLFHPYFNDTVNYIIQFLDRTFKDN